MTILSLWLPILVSAVLVFIASAAVWTALPWHKTDFAKTEKEDSVREALRGQPPGYYMLPYVMDREAIKQPEFQQKWTDGPNAYITVIPNGMPNMGPKLVQSFVYYLGVGVICAYLVSRTMAADSDYLSVFRIAGTVSFIAYGIAYIQDSIWFGGPWAITGKNLVDALIYGLITGGVFGWLAV